MHLEYCLKSAGLQVSRSIQLLSCSSLEFDEEEELLLLLLDELLDELEEFDDELESLSLPSSVGAATFA